MTSRRVSQLIGVLMLIALMLHFAPATMASNTNQCGELQVYPVDSTSTITIEGLTVYTISSTNRGLQSNSIRSLTMGKEGLAIGYAGSLPHNVSFMTADQIEICGSNRFEVSGHVNAIGIDEYSTAKSGDWFVVTDGQGVYQFHKGIWIHLSTQNGLSDDRGYGIEIDIQGNACVPTWEGVSCFNIQVPDWNDHPELTNPRASQHIHVIRLIGDQEVWLGHIDQGISRRTNDGWVQYTVSTHPDIMLTDAIRTIEVNEDLVWFGGDPGYLASFNLESEEWSIYTLPAEVAEGSVLDLDWDNHNRLWVTTTRGVVYQQEGVWEVFTDLPSLNLEFGCSGCAFDENQIFIGTEGFGLARGQLPQ